jgi:hypothetical protein
MKPFWIVLAVVFVLVAVLGVSWMSAVNREASLRNRFVAKQKANEASFDAMWKIIQQKGGVADKYKDGFKEVFKEIINGRYKDGGGSLVKMIHEANPAFDASLYNGISASIEGERRRFLRDQELLLDIKREHDDVRTRFPSRLFVGGDAPLEPTIVTSQKTSDAFRDGREELDK